MKRIRCPCGKVLAIPAASRASKFRCPACSAVLRVRVAEGSTHHPPKSRRVLPPPVDTAPEDDDAGYEVVHDSESEADATASAPARDPLPAFIPSGAVMAAGTKHARAYSVPTGSSYGTAQAAVSGEDFPGPFIDASALLYPFLHPTWASWIGLSFVTALTLAAIAITFFFLAVIMTFGAFASLFTFATMTIGCVALVSYVMTTFEGVFEDSANGENRLSRLPGLSFADNLPSFLRISGALLCTIAIAGGLVHLLRDQLGPWETEEWAVNPMVALQLILIFDLVAWAVFPIFLISNSVEQSFWPIWALHTTVLRLIPTGGYYLVFLLLSAGAGIAIDAILLALTLIHWSMALIAVGPLYAMYLLYYAHWLGRVVRQMMVRDELITLSPWLVVTIRTAIVLVVLAIPGWELITRVWIKTGLWHRVSDGVYVMRTEYDAVQGQPAAPAEDEVQLRFAKDGTIYFLDAVGHEHDMRGTISKGKIRLRGRSEAMVMEGKGTVTGRDRMEGTFKVKEIDIGFAELDVIEKKAKWSLVKKK